MVCYEHSEKVYFDSCAYVESDYNPFGLPDSCNYVIFLGGGIPKLTSLSSFTTYPNPTANKVTVRLEVSESANFDICVKDVQGKVVTSYMHLGQLNIGLHNAEMDLSALSPGFYLIECQTSAGSLYSKLMIQ